MAPWPFVTRSTTRLLRRLRLVEVRPDVPRRPGVGERVARAAVRGEDRLPVRRFLRGDARCRRRRRRSRDVLDGLILVLDAERVDRRRRRTRGGSGRRRAFPARPSTVLGDREPDLRRDDLRERVRRHPGLACLRERVVEIRARSCRSFRRRRACGSRRRPGRTASCPVPWLPALVYPPVPQPESASASAAVHAAATSTTGLTGGESNPRERQPVWANRCSCFRIRRTSGAVGSSGASLRNALYAAIVVATSFADCRGLARARAGRSGPSAGSAAILRYCSTACADAVWISDARRGDLALVARAHGVRDRVGLERAAAELEDRVADRRRARGSAARAWKICARSCAADAFCR